MGGITLGERTIKLNDESVKLKIEPQHKSTKSQSDIIKVIVIIVLGSLGLFLEIYGFKFGYLRYLSIDIVALVLVVGLHGFSSSYNRIIEAHDEKEEKNRIKLSAEIAATIGVASLTFAVALGVYNFDATNSEANSSKLLSVQRQMVSKAKILGCQINPSDVKDCKNFYDALNGLWVAVLASDVKGMSSGVDNVRLKWIFLGARWPHQNFEEYKAAIDGLGKLQYWSDTAKQQIALLFALILLPFSVSATSRKLAVAAFDANFSETRVTWRMVARRALFSLCKRTMRGEKRCD